MSIPIRETNPYADDVHSNIVPVEVYAGDSIVARIKKNNTSASIYKPIQVSRMSPLGVELEANSTGESFQKGDSVNLEITIAGQRSVYAGLVVEETSCINEQSFLSVRLNLSTNPRTNNEERRSNDRWLCGSQFFPTCITTTPGRFNDYIYFQIRDISTTGFKLACSLRNKFLLVGMKFQLQVSLPLVANTSVNVVVRRINISSESGKDYLVIGASYSNLSQSSKNVLGQYLVQFGDISSLDELRNANFLPRSISRGVDFYFLKTESDYRDVLDLRLTANADIGHISPGISAEDMADEYDSRARIIVAKHRNMVVATARMLYPSLEENLELEQFVKWPSTLPRKDQLLEVSRAATHRSFRKNDLLATLFGFIATACAQSGRAWVIISSTDELVPFYEKLGWNLTNLSYKHPTFGNINQNILIANIQNVLCGKGVHPLYWNFVWKDAAQHASESNTFVPTGTDRLRMSIYRSLSPIGEFLFSRNRINKFRT